MNLLTPLIHALRNDPWRAFPFAAIAGGSLLAWTMPPHRQEGFALFLLQAAACFMLYLSSSAATRLAHTAQILARRRIPEALWTGAVKRRMASVWGNGVALLAALMVQWLLGTPAHMLANVAVLSLAACAGTLYSTLRSGLLPRVLKRNIYPVALVALVLFFLYGHAALMTLVQFHTATLLLLALAWPLMALALRRYWCVMPHVPMAIQAADIPAWGLKIKRYSFLQPRFLQDNNLQSNLLGGLRMGMAVLCWELMQPLTLGGTVTVGHLLAIIPWLPAAMGIVATRDLHWRTLLAPAGNTTPPLAMQIYRTSLKLALLLVLLLTLGQGALTATLGLGAAQAIFQMEKWLVFGMQAPLLIAIAVLLCALPNPRITMLGTFIAACLALALIHLAGLYHVPVGGLRAGFGYAAGMAVLAGLVMLGANRVWTPNKLLQYLPVRPNSGAELSAAR